MSKAYITDKNLMRHSRLHNVYAGDPTSDKTDAGNAKRLLRATAINGTYRQLDEKTRQVLEDLGHASSKRPTLDE